MAYSQGSSRLQYWLDKRGLKQADLSRLSGWSKNKPHIGWSPRMVSFFCTGTTQMSPEALFTFSLILGVRMDQLNEWDPTTE